MCVHLKSLGLVMLLLAPGMSLKGQTSDRIKDIPSYHYRELRSARLALKNNLLLTAAASLNLGLEVRLSGRLSLDVPFVYNPWTFSGDKKHKHILVQPELRYWLGETFNGHFFGIHTHWGQYNVGGWNIGSLENNRYQGDFYGAGLSWGYQCWLSERWNLEATLGFGYAYSPYERYQSGSNGALEGKSNKQYVGPTRIGVSLVYILK